MIARGTAHYGQVQQQAARSLEISIRSLRRLVKAWQKEGILGLSRQIRCDRGKAKISKEWQNFIIKTYREGNRGSRKMSGSSSGASQSTSARIRNQRKAKS